MKNVNKFKTNDGKLYLNVASSTHVVENFINIDNHIFIPLLWLYKMFKWAIPSKYHDLFEKYIQAKKNAVLIRHDCRKRLPFLENSVDHILCSHFLEHVFPSEMDSVIIDFKRILKPGGTVHIIVPDIHYIIQKYLDNKGKGILIAADQLITDTILSTKERGTIKYRLLELLGGFGLQHRWMYDKESLSLKISSIGLIIVDVNETPSKEYYKNDNSSVHLVAIKKF